jgi:hypothetical protein
MLRGAAVSQSTRLNFLRRIRSLNQGERILREIGRGTRVVGAFPDRQSVLNLGAARLQPRRGKATSHRRDESCDQGSSQGGRRSAQNSTILIKVKIWERSENTEEFQIPKIARFC